ncbi:MAG: phosphoribosyl-ATP diphosphatase [Burkholderiaceae bacterium]
MSESTRTPDDAPAPSSEVLDRLARILAARREADPERSYVARLFARGNDAILKKIGEEATETVMAAKDGVAERIVAETADLWFHCLVMLEYHGLHPDQVLGELASREGLSGLDEKASRKAAAREAADADSDRLPGGRPQGPEGEAGE